MNSPINAVEGLWLAQAMKHSLWLYPTVETLHLMGMAALFGSILLVDLRILGLGQALAAGRLSRFAIAVTIAGFVLVAMTGFMMFITHASEFIASRLFVAKISLLFLLFLNAVSLHLRVQPTREGVSDFDLMAKVQATVSIIGWAAVIAMGRWLAYV